MSVNINIDNGIATTAQCCLPASTETGDDLALYSKIASAFVLCAMFASGFVTILRAIKAMHADLVKTRSVEAPDSTSAIPTNEARPIEHDAVGSQVLDPDVSDQSDTEQVEQPSAWRELRLVTVAWLLQSFTTVTAAATGAVLGTTPETEAQEMLPNPVPMT